MNSPMLLVKTDATTTTTANQYFRTLIHHDHSSDHNQKEKPTIDERKNNKSLELDKIKVSTKIAGYNRCCYYYYYYGESILSKVLSFIIIIHPNHIQKKEKPTIDEQERERVESARDTCLFLFLFLFYFSFFKSHCQKGAWEVFVVMG